MRIRVRIRLRSRVRVMSNLSTIRLTPKRECFVKGLGCRAKKDTVKLRNKDRGDKDKDQDKERDKVIGFALGLVC